MAPASSKPHKNFCLVTLAMFFVYSSRKRIKTSSRIKNKTIKKWENIFRLVFAFDQCVLHHGSSSFSLNLQEPKNSVDIALNGVQVNHKRKRLTISDKLKVIAEYDSGKSKRSIAKIFGISDHQVEIICQNRVQLLEVKGNGSRPLRACKVSTKCVHPEIDAVVLKWFKEMRNPEGRLKPLPISGKQIQIRAQIEARHRGLTQFKASNGWLRNWLKRNNVQ
jgi:CENP-B N-terminal DNA-binding domain/Tc5 transposase DNA-binding domain